MSDDLRQRIAERHGVGDAVDQLRGETPAELEAFAAAVAALRQREEPRPIGKHDAFIRLLHPDKPHPDNVEQPEAEFDGGARRSVPPPSDPESDHNAFLLDLFERGRQ